MVSSHRKNSLGMDAVAPPPPCVDTGWVATAASANELASWISTTLPSLKSAAFAAMLNTKKRERVHRIQEILPVEIIWPGSARRTQTDCVLADITEARNGER